MSVAELLNLVSSICSGDEAGLAGTAIAAEGHGRAFLAVGPASALIDGASLVSNVVLMDELVSSKGRPSETTLVLSLAGDEHLGREVDVGPDCLARNLDAVGERGGRGVCPARAAVLRKVLVAHVG